MAAINRDVTEEMLQDIYNAIIAIQKEKGRTETAAVLTARDITYAVFRGLFTYESVLKSIIGNAGKVFAH